jgi:hypothetical protein
MVATPYVLLGAFGFMIYRGFKKMNQAELAQGVAQPVDRVSGEPHPSIGTTAPPLEIPPESD